MLAIMLTRTAGWPAASGNMRPYSATGSTASAGQGWSRRTSMSLEGHAERNPAPSPSQSIKSAQPG